MCASSIPFDPSPIESPSMFKCDPKKGGFGGMFVGRSFSNTSILSVDGGKSKNVIALLPILISVIDALGFFWKLCFFRSFRSPQGGKIYCLFRLQCNNRCAKLDKV